MKMVDTLTEKRCPECGLVFAANLTNFLPFGGGRPGILCRECARRLRRERRRTLAHATEGTRTRSSSERG